MEKLSESVLTKHPALLASVAAGGQALLCLPFFHRNRFAHQKTDLSTWDRLKGGESGVVFVFRARGKFGHRAQYK